MTLIVAVSWISIRPLENGRLNMSPSFIFRIPNGLSVHPFPHPPHMMCYLSPPNHDSTPTAPLLPIFHVTRKTVYHYCRFRSSCCRDFLNEAKCWGFEKNFVFQKRHWRWDSSRRRKAYRQSNASIQPLCMVVSLVRRGPIALAGNTVSEDHFNSLAFC